MPLQAIFFLLAYAGTLIGGLFYSPVLALQAYLLAFYMHPPSKYWGYAVPDLRWSFIAAIVLLIATFTSRAVPHRGAALRYGLFRLLAVYVIWMYCQYLWALNPVSHDRGVSLLSNYLLVVFLMVAVLNNWQRVETFLMSMVVASLYLGWMAFGVASSGRFEGVGGPGIGNANKFGLVLAGAAILAGVLFHIFSGWKKWLAALAVAFTLNGMFQTGSRGAVVALFCGGLALFWLRPPGQLGRLFVYASLASVAVAILAGPTVIARMEHLKEASAGETELETSATSRLVIARAQLEMAKNHPLGGGHDTTDYLSATY